MTHTGDAGSVQAAALALHRHLRSRVREGVLVGPDSGVRVNYRVGRFVKSYTRWAPWRDDHCYMQAQGYWMLANWRLSEVSIGLSCEDTAVAAAHGVMARQRADGAWDYPNPEWRGRVATAEGTWAAIGLLETYRRTEDVRFLDAALRWYDFLGSRIGWVRACGGRAVNYFSDGNDGVVPNNSVMVLRLLAELADVTADERFLDACGPMLGFLASVQRHSGELPYKVDPVSGAGRPEHFQCAQYHAFETIDLARYEELTGDARAEAILLGLVRFLQRTVTPDGCFAYACGRPHPRVAYHAAAVSTALEEGARHGLDVCAGRATATRARLLKRQTSDGSFPHSTRDYGFLADRRSYPRNLAMILSHLLDSEPVRRGSLGRVLA